jgi:site-specific DNA-methyltransferase (adenine-specific)
LGEGRLGKVATQALITDLVCQNSSEEQRRLSKIDKKDFDGWFRQIWSIPGASTRNHPAPFPLELATRLVCMFSFTGDTVLDPFCGSGTTMVAALKNGRNSIGVEIDREYYRMAARRLKAESSGLFSSSELIFEKAQTESSQQALYLDPELSRLRVARQHSL